MERREALLLSTLQQQKDALADRDMLVHRLEQQVEAAMHAGSETNSQGELWMY
jgi:hypothetical protein